MRPVHEARLVAGQEERGLGHLHRFADAAPGGGDGGLGHVDAKGLQGGHLSQTVRGFDEAGADGVAADAPVAEFNGDGAGKHIDGTLGGVIEHLHRGAGHGRDRRGADDRPAPGGNCNGAVTCALPRVRSTMATATPSAAKSSDAAPPMPVAPPEISTTLPLSLFLVVWSSVLGA